MPTALNTSEPENLEQEISLPSGLSYFGFFVVSGFCGLLYEVVWLRLAMASFGVTAALVAVVLSMFMAGLSLGSWGAGRMTRKRSGAVLALRLYALAELLVALSSVLVPYELKLGRSILQNAGQFSVWQTSNYYLLSGLWVGITIVPWCVCMGATFPLLISVIRQTRRSVSERAFSYLYVANVLGALIGTFASAFVLIELLGFRKTLYVAGALNTALAISALAISFRLRSCTATAVPIPSQVRRQRLYGMPGSGVLWMLFTTGLVSMGMEVVWVRQLTPYLGNVVYAFAGILGVYLLATLLGSYAYRLWVHSHQLEESAPAWSLLALFAIIPLLAVDPLVPFRLGGSELGGFRLAGIVLFCSMAGFLTPLLVDSWSGGDPERAGTAYAVNLVGSILGPLVAGFCLLPWLGERRSVAVLALPLFVIAGITAFRKSNAETEVVRPGRRLNPKLKFVLATVVSIMAFRSSHDYEQKYPVREVRRDYTATVMATGAGFDRELLVNGVGMTTLTPITKYMAHLPLAFMSRPPQNGLVICFGMGTSFRSMLSWGIKTTSVDLVPSVPLMFGYFHPDAQSVMSSPLARIVVDDGRRFLDGSSESYDVIVVDPPPPVWAPGSSLLYSREFYEVIKKHLRPSGILQMWYPMTEGDTTTAASVARALAESFHFVRAFSSLSGFGVHFLASMEPLPMRSSSQLASRLPSSAVSDFVEWGPEASAQQQFEKVLSQEVKMEQLFSLSPGTPALQDDRPINEYFLMRRWFKFHNYKRHVRPFGKTASTLAEMPRTARFGKGF